MMHVETELILSGTCCSAYEKRIRKRPNMRTVIEQ